MLKTHTLQYEHTIPPLWRLAFRPLFLFAAVFACVAMAMWAGVLAQWWSFTPFGGMLLWHAHEMLFGFVGAIAMGFLLTAAQTWTGMRSLHGTKLIYLVLLWACGRGAMLIGQSPGALVIALNSGFYLCGAIYLWQLLWRARNTRNLFLSAMLIGLAVFDGVLVASHVYQQPALYRWSVDSSILLIATMITVIGGRIIPMFTANGTGSQRTPPSPWIERVVLFSTWLLVAVYISRLNQSLPPSWIAVLFTTAGLSNLIRWLRWRPWITWKQPLLWSLHLGYAFLPVTQLLLALNFVYGEILHSQLLHGFTAGAMGSMILAMLARVSLGHTGRPLQLPHHFHWALACILLAGIIRLTVNWFPAWLSQAGYLLSAGLWCVAFVWFVVKYGAILASPRIDGRPG